MLIDDGEAFISYTSLNATQTVQLLTDGSVFGINFIATSLGSMFKGFDAISGKFKAPQSGLVLGAPEEASMHFASCTRIVRGQQTPDIGFWYRRGDFKRMKLPLVKG